MQQVTQKNSIELYGQNSPIINPTVFSQFTSPLPEAVKVNNEQPQKDIVEITNKPPQKEAIDVNNETFKQLKEDYIDSKLGLVAFCFDKLKNLTGLGKSSKKALKKLEEFNAGKATKEETERYLKDYKYSQKDATEVVADLATGAAAFGAYSGLKKIGIIGGAFHDLSKTWGGKVAIAAAIVIGAISKPILKRLNMIGVDKKTRKKEGSFGKDLLTGALDGILAPVTLLKNMVLGIPVVLGVNSITRYLFIKKDNKSFKDYFNQQIEGIDLKILAAVAVFAKARKGHLSLKGWNESVVKSLENVKNLKPLEMAPKPPEFHELVNQIGMMDDGKIAQILMDESLSVEQKMLELEKHNIFVPKFLQTIPDNILEMGGQEELGQIVTRFKSDCPVSRTVDQAQELISNTFGDKYIIQGNKALGTGTVAETYLVKEKDTGKEAVIKLLKDGMSTEKIEKDRKSILDLLKQSNVDDPNRMVYFEKRVNALFDAWMKEIDLHLESDAAVLLGKNARQYNTIKPIEVKNNIYVMEKAPGVQFNRFTEYLGQSGRKINQKEEAFLMLNYIKVFFEQLLSVPRKGAKVMHADPHPGNVFIDIDNLEKPLTFIDTGNVLRYTPHEAITNVISHCDYLLGNSAGIAKSMLRGATLPPEMSEKQALELLAKELNEKMFNKHQQLPVANLFGTVNDFCLEVMDKNHIISNPNNTNLIKAEATYMSNITSLKDLWKHHDHSSSITVDQSEMKKQGRILLKEIGTSIVHAAFNNMFHTFKELRTRLVYISQNKEQFLSTMLGFTKNASEL